MGEVPGGVAGGMAGDSVTLPLFSRHDPRSEPSAPPPRWFFRSSAGAGASLRFRGWAAAAPWPLSSFSASALPWLRALAASSSTTPPVGWVWPAILDPETSAVVCFSPWGWADRDIKSCGLSYANEGPWLDPAEAVAQRLVLAGSGRPTGRRVFWSGRSRACGSAGKVATRATGSPAGWSGWEALPSRLPARSTPPSQPGNETPAERPAPDGQRRAEGRAAGRDEGRAHTWQEQGLRWSGLHRDPGGEGGGAGPGDGVVAGLAGQRRERGVPGIRRAPRRSTGALRRDGLGRRLAAGSSASPPPGGVIEVRHGRRGHPGPRALRAWVGLVPRSTYRGCTGYGWDVERVALLGIA